MAIEFEQGRIGDGELSLSDRASTIPWWLIGIILIIIVMVLQIINNVEYRRAYDAIIPGLQLTIYATIGGFVAASIIGLFAGLGRISKNALFRNLATAYIEFIRGVPMLVLIIVSGVVLIPTVTDGLNQSFGLDIRIPEAIRGGIALAVVYGAFMAEIFRAGVESIPKGQMEAARSVGMTHGQAMRYIVLPQAIRNVLPALGNDFIAMLKDSSLLSVLAVRELTQQAKLYTGSSFRYNEGYLVLTVLYLTMTLVLSLLLQWYQRRLRKGE
ncbi:MAG: amino acid ABC transporter permease [Anaerolineales bacterium]|nr:amino acid ABC transporter permease [Anaerolineales bacterium]MCB9128851.1 amino acid ABC transporter permease [Ardenticatenales bacterium]MCB9171418.1 amino acid ABC transporter permease [Ardenticatenales bacterium]